MQDALPDAVPAAKIRLDKWLWYARFFKTRGLAAKQVSGGHVRVNAVKVLKPAQQVGAGDVLTFAQGHDIRVVRIVAPGQRRGPAPEAQTLYDDMTPPREPRAPMPERGGARPTKRDRRAMDALKNRDDGA
ncbi:RNA-binding S4 domain-containing protein [Rhodalgimonas zhirmunskyi]|uniref:RNA-binding S4 domain-containing protein n=1 Tax=Rhodalgimonas zhirmunskyi TaxID=2964767 RepID=A0AAJ1UBK3_9RHOB|nr:RNA-binding S4 domain-containing protein [Rhodoalgimonas zhirmunskyi]MDQ2094813.1 RNA-binding S4 domain-containing protein [Rhodoalgimonas zhirmunskyi]